MTQSKPKMVLLLALFFLLQCGLSFQVDVYESGFCVKANGWDQNNGVIQINKLNINTQALRNDCLRKCRAYKEATGCEVIWNRSNRGCYVHTEEIAKGNRRALHGCWVFKPDDVFERGFCVKGNRYDQNNGVININKLNMNTAALRNSCLQKCRSYSTATGCEVIWDRSNRGCYVHTQEIAFGNGRSRHGCWVFKSNLDLVRMWAPHVKLAKNEQWRPSSVDYFLRRVNLRGGTNLNPLTSANLPSCNGNCYLETKTSLGCASCTRPWVLKGQHPNSAPVYAMVNEHSGNTMDIVYWFFFPYNRGKRVCIGAFANNQCLCGAVFGHCLCPRVNGCVGGYSTFGHHVGDWEHVIVRLKNKRPYSLFLSIHDREITQKYGGEFKWNGYGFVKGRKSLRMDGTHAMVYAAAGSHGIWPSAGRNVYKKLVNGDTLVDYTSDGASWKTWTNIKLINYKKNGGYSGSLRFLDFKGRWGNREQSCGIAAKVSGECILNKGPGGPQRSFIGEGRLD